MQVGSSKVEASSVDSSVNDTLMFPTLWVWAWTVPIWSNLKSKSSEESYTKCPVLSFLHLEILIQGLILTAREKTVVMWCLTLFNSETGLTFSCKAVLRTPYNPYPTASIYSDHQRHEAVGLSKVLMWKSSSVSETFLRWYRCRVYAQQ